LELFSQLLSRKLTFELTNFWVANSILNFLFKKPQEYLSL
jgi:hypothetical protein